MILVKLLLIACLLLIFYQDIKDRMVYWFLYPACAIMAFWLQFNSTNIPIAACNVLFNLSFVLILILACYVYTRLKIKKSFFKEVFGIGDLFFFVGIAFTFSVLSFFVLFVFSLFFALLLHASLKKDNFTTVPLAGYMALFFAGIYTFSFLGGTELLYAY